MQIAEITKVTLEDGTSFTLDSVSHDEIVAMMHYAARMVELNRKIPVIKTIRHAWGLGLKEAKFFAEEAAKVHHLYK